MNEQSDDGASDPLCNPVARRSSVLHVSLFRRSLLALFFGTWLYGCPSSSTETPDASEPEDATVVPDAAPDASEPDATEPDATEPDATPIDVGFRLRAADFAPATGSAGSAEHNLQGSFGASSPPSSSNTEHRLRGSFGPLSP